MPTIEPPEFVSITAINSDEYSIGITDQDAYLISVVEESPIALAPYSDPLIVVGGSISEAVAQLPAGINLSGHRVIALVGGVAVYADNTIAAHAHLAIGVNQSAAGIGTLVEIFDDKIIEEPTWSWTTGEPVFLGTNGLLTQTPPVSPALFSLQIGNALSATKLNVNIQRPIFL
jgi:hypothetical protein